MEESAEGGWDNLRVYPRDSVCTQPAVDAAIQCVRRLMQQHQISFDLIVGLHVIAPIHDKGVNAVPATAAAAQHSAR